MSYVTQSSVFTLIPLLVVVALILFGILYMRRRGYSTTGANTIVRCREGHLFTTIWVPFMSFKSIRLGPIRYQRCPVDNHLTFVTPVKESELTDEEKQLASRYHDTPIP